MVFLFLALVLLLRSLSLLLLSEELLLHLPGGGLDLGDDLLGRALDGAADLFGDGLELGHDLLGDGLDLAADLAGGAADFPDQPVGDEINHDDGGGGHRVGEPRSRAAGLNRFEERNEAVNSLENAADRAPGRLQSFDDGHQGAGGGHDHGHQLFDQDGDQRHRDRGLQSLESHLADLGQLDAAFEQDVEDHHPNAHYFFEFRAEPVFDRLLERFPDVVLDAVNDGRPEIG